MKSTFGSAITNILRSKKSLFFLTFFVVSLIFIMGLITVLSKDDVSIIPSFGNIKTIGISSFSDKNCIQEVTSVNFEKIQLGKSEDVALFIKSISNYNVVLDLQISDWDPISVSKYLTLTWNYDGTILESGEIIELTLTLFAPSSSGFTNYLIKSGVENFSCSIQIIALYAD